MSKTKVPTQVSFRSSTSGRFVKEDYAKKHPKSSMMKLLRTALGKHENVEFRFVEFNAWLYQNYDDARAALMEAIAAAVVEQAVAKKDSLSETAIKHARNLLGRVKKLRLRRARGDDNAPELEKPWNEAFHMNWLALDLPAAAS